jgi:hypothetical protein
MDDDQNQNWAEATEFKLESGGIRGFFKGFFGGDSRSTTKKRRTTKKLPTDKSKIMKSNTTVRDD